MPIGPGQPGHSFTQAGITANATSQSGVYALYNAAWIYFGGLRLAGSGPSNLRGIPRIQKSVLVHFS